MGLMAFVLVMTSVSMTSAEELKIVLWNGERLFNLKTVQGRAPDLLQFGLNHREADIVILDEVTSLAVVNAARDRMGFMGYHTACSDFSQNDADTFNSLEVGIISRFPLKNVVEFDRTPDNTGAPGEPDEKILVTVKAPGIEAMNTSRGFLTADVPALGLTLVATHLKSSRGAAGAGDQGNAKKREFVSAAIAKFVVDKMDANPASTVLVAGDLNVGETDRQKNGFRLTEDKFRREDGDLYDDTHAIFSSGVIMGLQMTSLTKALGGETYDDVQFAGVGPIDCMYIIGKQAGDFTLATKSTKTFGSDHFSVTTRFLFRGTPPAALPPRRRPTPSSGVKLGISSLFPNPEGADGNNEWVVLTNRGPKDVQLMGWRMQDRSKNSIRLSGLIKAGGELKVALKDGQMPLNNNGDTVELLDATGEVVHSVTYSQVQAAPGRIIRF